ncbi:MAG TPA: hypothetical protein VEV15_12895 [Flavisolibacter sp.]|nr:hypothetical protein [Flavisolibacter sp.]
MAKTQVISWSEFYGKKEVEAPKVKDFKTTAKKLVPVAVAVIAGVTFALHGDFTALAAPITPDGDAVAVMAQGGADFAGQLRKATKAIRDIIFAFGHEIYFVMMAWGGIEALIGKTQQGFGRMKASTAAYVVLYWVPWIVETVSKAVPQ